MKKFSKIIKFICIITALSLMCIGFSGCGEDNEDGDLGDYTPESSENQTTDSGTSSFSVPADDGKGPYAVIDIKDYGKITVKLYKEYAPITVENFINLAESKFYDGLTFHRIMYGFMMQGGDPNGNGSGGSSKNIKGEFKQNGVNNPLPHNRGAISMARNGFDMNSASSQFFIVHKESQDNHLSLDGQYACFGYVTEGIEVVDKVCESARPTDNNGTIPKSEQPIINSVRIIYK